MKKIKMDGVRCPNCNSKTRNRIREDTVLRNYPLYCPKGKQEFLIEVNNLHFLFLSKLFEYPYILMARALL